MIIFLPVARYRVEFQVASGRPFSTFERLVLAAINEGRRTLNDLAPIFGVHQRLIVEAVVTLMQAGWVSLGAKSYEFSVTPAGKLACGEQKELPPTIVLDTRVNTIVMEKVTGQIARNNEVDFYPKSRLRKLWSSGMVLPKGDVSNRLDPGMVAPLLQHDSTEWVRSIEQPYVVSDNASYFVVDADTRENRVMGIPKSWEPILAPEMLDRARRREQELVQLGTIMESDELKSLVKPSRAHASDELADEQAPWTQVEIIDQDILTSVQSHLETLEYFLTRSISYVCLSGALLANVAVQRLLPLFEGALRRDLLITVLWGHQNPDTAQHKAALEALKKLSYDTAKSPNFGRLVFSGSASGSAANILLGDLESGIEVVVGSFSWTSSAYDDNKEKNLSIRLRAAKIVARFCDILGDLSSSDEKVRTSSGIVRLEKGAAQMRSTSAGAASNNDRIQARLVLDLEHKTMFRDAVSTASTKLSICSTELNLQTSTGLIQPLVDFANVSPHLLDLTYGRDATPKSATISLEQLSKQGVVVRVMQGLRTNMLSADNGLLILTSYPWLSDPLPSLRPYAAEVGIALRGEAVGKIIASATPADNGQR